MEDDPRHGLFDNFDPYDARRQNSLKHIQNALGGGLKLSTYERNGWNFDDDGGLQLLVPIPSLMKGESVTSNMDLVSEHRSRSGSE